jgi:hypothetical protein
MDGISFEKMKVIELRAELEKRGLNTSGLKADLIQRLMESDNSVMGQRC